MIPVKDLAKYDKVPLAEEEEEQQYGEAEMEEVDVHSMSAVEDKSRQRQLMLVNLVFLAEA